jgi:hypothetical protein
MKSDISRPVAIVLAILFLVLPGSLSAREKRGATLIVTLKDGHFAEGELIAVKPDSLLLLAGRDVSVPLAEIRSIRVVRKSKALVGGLCGLAAGVALTAFCAADTDLGPYSPLGDLAVAVAAIPTGIGLGAGAGALAGKDKVIRLEGMTDPQVRVALVHLRKKARIRKTS